MDEKDWERIKAEKQLNIEIGQSWNIATELILSYNAPEEPEEKVRRIKAVVPEVFKAIRETKEQIKVSVDIVEKQLNQIPVKSEKEFKY